MPYVPTFSIVVYRYLISIEQEEVPHNWDCSDAFIRLADGNRLIKDTERYVIPKCR